MNNKIVCVLQENANILGKYIWYYRYKKGLSNVLKWVFSQGFVSVEVYKTYISWFRAEAELLRNSCRKIFLYENLLIVIFPLIQVLLDNNIGFFDQI